MVYPYRFYQVLDCTQVETHGDHGYGRCLALYDTKATRLSGYSLSTPGYALLPICMVLEGRNTVNIHIHTR